MGKLEAVHADAIYSFCSGKPQKAKFLHFLTFWCRQQCACTDRGWSCQAANRCFIVWKRIPTITIFSVWPKCKSLIWQHFVHCCLVCSFLYLIKKRRVITMEASYSCRLAGATVLPVEDKNLVCCQDWTFTVECEDNPADFAHCLHKQPHWGQTVDHSLPGRIWNVGTRSKQHTTIWTVPYLDPARGMPML